MHWNYDIVQPSLAICLSIHLSIVVNIMTQWLL